MVKKHILINITNNISLNVNNNTKLIYLSRASGIIYAFIIHRYSGMRVYNNMF